MENKKPGMHNLEKAKDFKNNLKKCINLFLLSTLLMR